VPYSGLITAHEDMGAFAWLSILDVTLKLLIAYLIGISPIDKLVFFGLLMLMVSILMIMIYRVFCICHYEEAHMKLFWDSSLYRSMTSFAGWNIIGGLAWMLKNHGANMLLNLFFGPIINAARGVAMSVTLAVNGFANSFLAAVFPQITKYYAQGRMAEMQLLVNRSLKFSFYIVFVVALPIMVNINYILSIWLVEVPYKANVFVILVFADMLIQSILGAQLSQVISATGNIKNFQIVGGINMLLIVPISYIFLKVGFGPETVFVVIILSGVLSGAIRLYYAHVQVGYSIWAFIRDVLLPVVKIFIVSTAVTVLLKYFVFSGSSLLNFVVLTLLSLTVSCAVVWIMGVTQVERNMLAGAIKSRVRKNAK